MRGIRVAGTLSALVGASLLGSTAAAQRPVATEIGLFGQHTRFDQELELDNTTGIGARLSIYLLLRNLAVEGDIQIASTDWNFAGGSQSVTYRPVAARLVYGIPLGQKAQLLLGAGYQLNVFEGRTRQVGAATAGNEYEDALTVLAGLKFCLNEAWSLRFDVPLDYNPSPNFTGSTTALDGEATNIGFRLGIGRMLKGTCFDRPVAPPPPPPPAAEPPPPPAPPAPPPNQAPVATISSPAAGASLSGMATLTGSCRDPEQGDVTGSARWRSSRDGDIGTGGSVTRQLSGGAHTITFTCTDGSGLTGSATVAVTAQELLVRMNWVHFDFNRATLTQAGRDTLDGIVRTLTQRADLTVAVEGHTDPFGSGEYNDALSTRRAQAVVDYLTRGGIAAARIGAKGFGEQCLLLDDNADRPTRSRAEHRVNRRVEIWSVGNAGVASTCRPRQ
ncbi:MAG TPA: OmpA family protein [Gemmatimonadaceae bacterium]|nr:OmpA family protein [Gemmatimonadaceae bacterium]